MRHSRKTSFKKVCFCLCVIAVSPFIAAFVVRSLPTISVAAGKVASISAGINFGEKYPSQKNEIVEQPFKQTDETVGSTETIDDRKMLSEGMPYDYAASDNEDSITDGSSTSDSTAEPAGDTGPKPYPATIETHSGVITAMTFPKTSGTQFFDLKKAGQVKNITSTPMDKLVSESKLLPEFKIKLNTAGTSPAEPQVLIMHTHTTESYEPYIRNFYDASFNSRTTDETKNMVSVGNEIEKQLTAQGIGVIHDKTIHDYPSYNGSYDRSRVTVQAILKQYPSIKVVLDIHRDAIEKDNGERIAPTVTINGKKAAQVMIISGCDNGKMNMPNYMKNFRFACLFQQCMESDYPGLTRPVLFAYKKYNQDLTTGSLLVEVGGHANSIDEAQYSGELIGKSLADALKSISQ